MPASATGDSEAVSVVASDSLEGEEPDGMSEVVYPPLSQARSEHEVEGEGGASSITATTCYVQEDSRQERGALARSASSAHS